MSRLYKQSYLLLLAIKSYALESPVKPINKLSEQEVGQPETYDFGIIMEKKSLFSFSKVS